MNENNNASVKIYPNPAKNILTIEGLPAGNTKLRITDLNGNVVMRTTANNNIHKLNIAQLKNDAYILSISTDNEIITKKFVKE